MGALPRTTHSSILQESNLTPFSTLIVRSDLRLYLAIRNRQVLGLLNDMLSIVLDPLNEESEHTTLYSIGMQPYLYGFLDDSFTPTEVVRKLPAKVRRVSRCSFKNEVYLARFRMGRLPTRWWAASVGLCDTPLCRHCESAIEDEDHLFFNCPSLNYASFLPLKVTNLDELSELLHDTTPSLRSVEDAVLHFIYFNNLFRVDNVLQVNDEFPAPPSTPKRKIEISPSPSRPSKRSRRRSTSNPRKRSRSQLCYDSPCHTSPKRRFLGPATFIQQVRTLERIQDN